jgi:hypothetical protein
MRVPFFALLATLALCNFTTFNPDNAFIDGIGDIHHLNSHLLHLSRSLSEEDSELPGLLRQMKGKRYAAAVVTQQTLDDITESATNASSLDAMKAIMESISKRRTEEQVIKEEAKDKEAAEKAAKEREAKDKEAAVTKEREKANVRLLLERFNHLDERDLSTIKFMDDDQVCVVADCLGVKSQLVRKLVESVLFERDRQLNKREKEHNLRASEINMVIAIISAVIAFLSFVFSSIATIRTIRSKTDKGTSAKAAASA